MVRTDSNLLKEHSFVLEDALHRPVPVCLLKHALSLGS